MHARGFTAGQKKCGKSGLGYRAVAGRGPRAVGRGPLGLRAAGPLGRGGPWAAGRWAAGLLLAKPAVGLSYICGALVFGIANEIHWKLFGISLTSFALGAGETTVSALTSFYLEVCLSAFSSGTGTGFAMAPLYYMGK